MALYRLAFSGALSALLLVLAGCGGAGQSESTPATVLPVVLEQAGVRVAAPSEFVAAAPADYSPPVVSFSLLDSSGLTSFPDAASARINVTANEPLASLAVTSLIDLNGRSLLGNAALTSATGGTITSGQLLAGGAYTLTLLVADQAGNQATYQVMFSTKGSTAARASGGVIPAAAPVISPYTCSDASDTAQAMCLADPYAFKSFDVAGLLSRIDNANQADAMRSALLACKTPSSCFQDTAASRSFNEARRLREAASAVVKLTMPSDETLSLRLAYDCTGTVVRNTLDASLYIVTAAHCLFTSGGYYFPNIRYGTYRSTGAPITATFYYEHNSCGGTLDYSAFGTYTLNAYPVAYNYASATLAAPDPNRAYGDITDVALLKLAGTLPAGVTPVAVSSLSLSALEQAFSFSHPYGAPKSAGYFEGVASDRAAIRSNTYQYAVTSARRLVEHGSSGGPLFVYDSASDKVWLKGVLSTGSNAINNACAAEATAVYSRLDRHAPFLAKYLGPL